MEILKCKLCRKRGISIKLFKSIKEINGLPPNCICQSGSGDIGGYWEKKDFCNEDDLPEMTNSDYDKWFSESIIVEGVRMGPKV